jgi:hypothetical protein
VWQVAWAAAVAVTMSFAALGLLWTTPKLARWAVGRPAPAGVDTALRALAVLGRILALALFALVVVAAWFGTTDSATNLAPVAIYVVLWVGGQLGSALLGNLWAAISPFDTLAAIGQWLRTRLGRPDTPSPPSPSVEAASAAEPRQGGWPWSHWPAAAAIAGFLWLELAYHTPASPRVLALTITAYTIALLAGALRWGRSWLGVGDGFAALFTLLAALAPLARDTSGRPRLRRPFSGLASVEVRAGTTALVLITLGGTSFDGVTRTQWWEDAATGQSGWALTGLNTVGLAATIGVVALLYHGASWLSARTTGDTPPAVARRYGHSLVPIMLAYAIAHYFSLLVFEGQLFLPLLSDPLGRGWDVLGTSGWTIDYLLVSTTAIAWVQAVSVVVGHIVGVTAAHDRAIETASPSLAVRSQYPMLVVMVIYTVGALVLLLGA